MNDKRTQQTPPAATAGSSAERATALVHQARRLLARRRLLILLASVPVAAVTLVVVAGGLDATLAMPAALRLLIGVLALAILFIVPLVLWGRRRQYQPPEEQARRAGEHFLGDQDRGLTRTLELTRMQGDLASVGAQHTASNLPPSERLAAALPRPRLWRFATLLLALVAIAAIPLVMLPHLGSSLWARFTDPLGDHPPWARTMLIWDHVPERVFVGEQPVLRIHADGPTLQDVHLHSDAGAAIGMYRVGPNAWQAELPPVADSVQVWATSPGTRTRRRAITVDPIPQLQDCTVTLVPPDYAGLDDTTLRSEGRKPLSLEALAGSRLVVMPRANRPLTRLALLRKDPHGQNERIDAELTDGSATIADLAPGTWSMQVAASDGAWSQTYPLVTLERRPDERPRVAFRKPIRDAVAVIGQEVPVHISAEDDLGLELVTRARRHNGLAAPDLTDVADQRQWNWQGALDLSELGVAHGDMLLLAAVARDSFPAQAQLSTRAERRIQVIDEATYNEVLRRRLRATALRDKYRKLLEQMRELEQQARAAAGDSASSGSPSDDELAKRARELARAVAAMRRDDPLFQMEPAIQDAMGKALEELAQAAEEDRLDELIGKPPTAEQLQQDLQLMTDLAMAMGLVRRLRQIVSAQENTTARLEHHADHGRASDHDRVELRNLGDEEDRIAESIDDWLDHADSLTARLNERARTVRSGMLERHDAALELEALADALRGTGAADLKRQSADSAQSGDGFQAHRQASDALARLQDLLPQMARSESRCQGGAMSISWCNGSSMCRGLGLMAGLAGRGYGMGAGGLGGSGGGAFAAGYGDNPGGSDPFSGMNLYGPEKMGDMGGMMGDDGAGDAISAMAASDDQRAITANRYRRQRQRSAGNAERAHLDEAERDLVDRYFQLLDPAPRSNDTDQQESHQTQEVTP